MGPTGGTNGYITHAIWEVPNASKRGTKPAVAHKWAWWLHNPCLVGGAQRFKAWEQNQQWITTRRSGYITPAV